MSTLKVASATAVVFWPLRRNFRQPRTQRTAAHYGVHGGTVGLGYGERSGGGKRAARRESERRKRAAEAGGGKGTAGGGGG